MSIPGLPPRGVGWSVRDLVFHCLQDAHRGLVALHTPAQHPTDRDAVTYWEDWSPGGEGAANGRRHARVSASMFLHVEQLFDLYQETTGAGRARCAQHAAGDAVATQGHVLTAGDLMRTLAVEATMHHLDMAESLARRAGTCRLPGLTEVRRVLDGMLGRTGAFDVGRRALREDGDRTRHPCPGRTGVARRRTFPSTPVRLTSVLARRSARPVPLRRAFVPGT